MSRSPSRTTSGVGQLGRHGEQPVVVPAVDQRAEPHPVAQGVEVVGGSHHVGVRGVLGPERRQVEHDAHVGGAGLVEPRGGQAVPEQEVVRRPVGAAALAPTRRVHPGGVAQVGRTPGLVVGGPDAHPVAEPVVDDRGVVGERLGGVAVQPAVAVLERLRQVPVVERGGGRDAARQRRVDQPVVVVQSPGLDPADALGHDPRPGDREAVPPGSHAGHQVQVLLVPVVGVAGHRAVQPVAHGPGAGREGVPDRRAATVLGHRALDLVGRRGDSVGEGRSVRAGLLGTTPT